MTKLRNIGYLWFGSKIQQGFAVAALSLTPRLSFFPLWMLFAANADVGGLSYYIGGACRPPAGRSACLPPPCRAVGLPAAPPPGGRGLYAIELKF